VRYVTFDDSSGVDLRPVSEVVRLARKFEVRTWLECDGVRADAQNARTLEDLRVGHGNLLTIRADGPDEREALAALANHLIARGCGVDGGGGRSSR
jgi:phosphotransferase system HPr (HPr) family protein